MIIYCAGTTNYYDIWDNGKEFKDANVLQSFFYINKIAEELILPNCKRFMLDSGAFSFVQGGKRTDFEKFCDAYIDYINSHKIERFIEMDIDSIRGYDYALQLRKRIESRTQKQTIPVWHVSRGKDRFIDMCREYDYVAIGGIAGSNRSSKEVRWLHEHFPWFINTAHEHGAKIHGLGFTQIDGLRKYHFDSVDSSSWTMGSRTGCVFEFKDGNLITHSKREGKRIADYRTISLHNFREWVKFQKYAEIKL